MTSISRDAKNKKEKHILPQGFCQVEVGWKASIFNWFQNKTHLRNIVHPLWTQAGMNKRRIPLCFCKPRVHCKCDCRPSTRQCLLKEEEEEEEEEEEKDKRNKTSSINWTMKPVHIRSWYPNPIEAILAWHPALSTEWLAWVAKWCERWRNRTSPIISWCMANCFDLYCLISANLWQAENQNLWPSWMLHTCRTSVKALCKFHCHKLGRYVKGIDSWKLRPARSSFVRFFHKAYLVHDAKCERVCPA